MERKSFPPIANNQGITDTIIGNVLLHDLPGGRSCKMVKIMAYNPGANATLQFGTFDRNPAGAAFVALMPIFVAIGPLLDNQWFEWEIPNVEWENATALTAAGRTGDIWVACSHVDVVVCLEVVEFGG